MRYIHAYIKLILFLSLLTLTCQVNGQNTKIYRVVFLWFGSISDFAFNYKSEVARYEAMIRLNKDPDMETYFGGPDFEIEGIYYEDMVNDSITKETIDNEIRNHNTSLFVTNTGAHTAVFCEYAEKYKNTGFLSSESCSEEKGDNFAFILIRYTVGRYLSGTSCGFHSVEQNYTKIGFVTPRASGYLGITHANSFFYGARHANPNVEFYVIETEDWYDPIVGNAAAEMLIESGVQCVGSIEDSNIVQKRFTDPETPGLWATGYLFELRYSLGERILYSMTYPETEQYIAYLKNFILGGNKFNINDTFPQKGYPQESGFSKDLKVDSRRNISALYEKFINNQTDAICGKDLKNDNEIYHNLSTITIGTEECLKIEEESKVLNYSKFILNIKKISLADVLREVHFSIDTAVGKVFLALIILAFIINGIFLFDIIYYRETEVYNAASIVFCLIIICALTFGHVGLTIWYAEPNTASCTIKLWIVVVSIGLVHSALIFKNWRIMKIFNTMSLEVFKISNRDLLLKMVSPYLGGLFVILILWTSLDIFKDQKYTYNERDHLALNVIEKTCSSKTLYGIAATLIYTVLLLIIGCVVAYKTKGVKKKNYKEAESTAWITYNTLLIMVIAVLLQVILSSNVSVVVTDSIIFFVIWFILVTDAILLFFPKFYRIHFKGKTTLSTHETSTRSSNISNIGLKRMSSKVSSEEE